MAYRYNTAQTTGNLNTVVAGTVTAGSTLPMGRVKNGSLSAHVTVLAETNTLTISALWQVSNDASTWITCANGSQNAAAVVLATGTAGADAAVTRAIPAPDSVYAHKYARVAITNGVTTGGASDTYTLGYTYRT